MAHRSARNLFHLAVAAIAGLVLLVPAVPSDAGTRTITAVLTGSQETPPTGSTAQGGAVVVLDTNTNQLNWIVTHKVANPNAAHFHGNAFPGTAAPIIVNIGGGGLTSPIVGSTILTPQQATDLLAGRWYVNIHSTTFINGEIRGQLATFFDAPVTIFPPPVAGLARTTGFDLTLFLNTGAATPVSATVTVNGADATSAVLACVRPGTIVGGGQTLRCHVPGGLLVPGTYFVSVVVGLNDGTSVGTTASWFVGDSTEP